jgi:NAD(P)-dependent dehydrogenase (short-subunit alcohol dehydrogenase family)
MRQGITKIARLMNIHVKGVFFLTQKLLPLIKERSAAALAKR